MSSLKFVAASLGAIAAAKDTNRDPVLAEAVKKALEAIKNVEPQFPDPEIIFAPLQLATRSGSIPLTTTALDCIGKLISYSYFSIPSASAAAAAAAAATGSTSDGEHDQSNPQTQQNATAAATGDAAGSDRAPLIERAIDTICDCFQGESTPAEIQLQIVKSLLAAVLNDKIVVHGAGLLKAIRQVYNVFLLSRNASNQQVAQGTLTQMVGTVFERVKLRLQMKETRLGLSRLKQDGSNATFEQPDSLNGGARHSTANDGDGDDDSSEAHRTSDGASASASASTGPANGDGNGAAAKLTLKDLEHRKSFDDSNLGDGPTMVTHLKRTAASSARSISEQTNPDSPHDDAPEALDAEDEVYIRDAYLVFRSFCNLSTKVLPPDQLYDLRGQPMRSKLVSLHLIHTLLNNNMAVFTSPLCTITNTKSNEPTSFLQAVKFYLCLSITRNGASSVDRVFEVCTEIFWLMLKFMRAPFKKEIEVFLNEIYLALLARKTAPLSQKLYFIGILNRFCADPRALVETYLNYDCERNVDNIFQTIVEHLSKLAITPVPVTSDIERAYEEKHGTTSGSDWQIKTSLPPPLTVSHIMPHYEPEPEFPKEYVMKRISLDALVESLRSMVNWSQAGRPDGVAAAASAAADAERKASMDDIRESIDPDSVSRVDTPIMPSTPVMDDDPEHLEREKARKTALWTAIRAFNFKPKRGIKMLIDQGFIASDSPVDIANFLVSEDRLDKAQIGEYLGEGDPKNIETMHAFVNTMNFTRRRFVDALRQFLQSFRLPGESQKIDRFMLKFAERYNDGNPNAFANADTAYVLAYSVIMLNTDLHSSQVVKRMTKQDFIRNNRGINDNADLPDEYLIGIYDEIASNEIVLNSERAAAAAAGTLPPQQPTGLAGAFSNVGRDLQREAYVQQSEEISLRSEQLFKNLFRSQRRNATKAGGVKFVPATNFKHIGPMFDVTWMSYFSAFSSQMQNAHNLEVNRLCLEGMKLATKIACQFELSTPRAAFISALRNAANLNNVQELYAKNFEALRVLLELGYTEGNYLRESWKDILISVSQLERLQLMASGINASAVPDVSKARFVPPSKERGGSIGSNSERKSMQRRPQQPRPRAPTGPNGFSSLEIAYDLTSDDTIKTMDRIFTNTANLSGAAINHFAQALTEVSWDEIKVSGSNDNPRMYSLQKIVEISYYNMTRVRFEWTNIWDVLGDHFNKIGSHANEAVVFFALDSLRQLSMRFMELEELPGFKFQKDFLKPFEHVMANSSNIHVKDMALRCLIQMIQARGENIRSGWRTMFGAFTVAARDPAESIVNMAFENVTQVFRTRFGVVIAQGAFTDLIVCLTEFSKNIRFQKKSLQAMETLKAVIPKMLKTPECPLSQQRPPANGSDAAAASDGSDTKPQPSRTSVEEGFWFPVLFAFHDVLMTGEDLEVRSNALNYFFETLLRYGGDFPPDFWDILWRQQLYPIFLVLRSRPEMSNVLSHEELSVWLSTTMIQALRNMITLFTHYFDALEYMLDRFLELLALCILQENDTIARIGSNCLQQLVLQNVNKFSGEHWSKIVGAFCELFERTTAYQLFSATTINSAASLAPASSAMEFGYALGPGLPSASDDDKSLKIGSSSNTNGDVEASDAISTLSVPSTTVTAPEDDDGDDAESSHHEDVQRTPRGPSIISTDTTAQQPALEEFKPTSSLQQQPVVVTAARRRFFNRIISRCVLQLLMIETVNELFSNEVVYAQIPSTELLRLMALLKKSFLFARRFNNDKELRMRLWREGFMKQPPNLLKQESGSAATYVAILFKMYADQSEERQAKRADVESALVPLCKDILQGYLALEDESQHRNIMAWRPVVVDVLEGYAHYFPEASFVEHLGGFYPSMIELLSRELSLELRTAIVQVLRRVGEVSLGIKGLVAGTHLTESAGPLSGEETFAQGMRRRRRGDSVMSMATTATANEGPAAVDTEGGDASTKFMGRRLHSPSMQE